MRTALSIAGSDSSGGAGIQADIKTMTANGVYAMTAVTALTAQNTTGVTDILEATPSFLAAELDAVFTDIFPDAVKIGMVSSAELITVIADKLTQYGAKHIVVDPVMVATSGSKLLRDDAIGAVADGRQQIAELEPLRDQLADAQRSNEELNEQVATMQQTISRYEKVLGNADTAHQRADSIVRPFIEQANRQADETLDSVQAVLAGVLAQLGELQGSVDQRRQALRRCKADSDSRLSSAFGDWLAPTKDINPYDHHFFR